MLATTTGSDAFTFNAILGGWVRPAPFLELGLSGQIIPADITTNSQLSITSLNPALPGTISLTRNGLPANDVTVTLPLPIVMRAGARYRHLVEDRELFDVESLQGQGAAQLLIQCLAHRAPKHTHPVFELLEG